MGRKILKNCSLWQWGALVASNSGTSLRSSDCTKESQIEHFLQMCTSVCDLQVASWYPMSHSLSMEIDYLQEDIVDGCPDRPCSNTKWAICST